MKIKYCFKLLTVIFYCTEVETTGRDYVKLSRESLIKI